MTKENKNTNKKCTIHIVICRIFNRWTKWQVYKADQMYIRTQVNHITGWESEPTRVCCDVMKKTNRYTGMVKYKTVVKG